MELCRCGCAIDVLHRVSVRPCGSWQSIAAVSCMRLVAFSGQGCASARSLLGCCCIRPERHKWTVRVTDMPRCAAAIDGGARVRLHAPRIDWSVHGMAVGYSALFS